MDYFSGKSYAILMLFNFKGNLESLLVLEPFQKLIGMMFNVYIALLHVFLMFRWSYLMLLFFLEWITLPVLQAKTKELYKLSIQNP